jgi:hypothetical protein
MAVAGGPVQRHGSDFANLPPPWRDQCGTAPCPSVGSGPTGVVLRRLGMAGRDTTHSTHARRISVGGRDHRPHRVVPVGGRGGAPLACGYGAPRNPDSRTRVGVHDPATPGPRTHHRHRTRVGANWRHALDYLDVRFTALSCCVSLSGFPLAVGRSVVMLASLQCRGPTGFFFFLYFLRVRSFGCFLQCRTYTR